MVSADEVSKSVFEHRERIVEKVELASEFSKRQFLTFSTEK